MSTAALTRARRATRWLARSPRCCPTTPTSLHSSAPACPASALPTRTASRTTTGPQTHSRRSRWLACRTTVSTLSRWPAPFARPTSPDYRAPEGRCARTMVGASPVMPTQAGRRARTWPTSICSAACSVDTRTLRRRRSARSPALLFSIRYSATGAACAAGGCWVRPGWSCSP